ncbi:MAG: hypothetical protein WBP81_36980, partial [Solirubrobacteraceae bacterium]
MTIRDRIYRPASVPRGFGVGVSLVSAREASGRRQQGPRGVLYLPYRLNDLGQVRFRCGGARAPT